MAIVEWAALNPLSGADVNANYKWLGTGVYPVMAFGAIWDGNSHPLSERYGSLGAAQVVYPHATDLAEEIDWAATQAAINQVILDWETYGTASTAASGDRFGGTVVFPCGHGRFNRSVFYPANSNWTYQDYASVNLLGQGRQNTFLDWYDNAATIQDDYAVQPRTAVVTAGAVVWSGTHSSLHALCVHKGFSLRGPGITRGFSAPSSQADFLTRYGFEGGAGWATAYNTGNAVAGQVYEAYSGLSAGERTCLEDIGIYNFHVGLNLRGGQKWHRWLDINSCYYGVYGTFTAAAHGDMKFTKCNFSGRWAAFGMHPAYSFYGHMDTCFLGGAPYAFYKEGSVEASSDATNAAAFGGHYGDFMCGVLTHCQFESVGNGIFGEANVTRRHELRNVTMLNCEYREPADWSFPANATGITGPIIADALIDVKTLKRVYIRNSHDPEEWEPRAASIFKSSAVEEVEIDGADGFIEAAAGTGKSVFKITTSNVQPGRVVLKGHRWNGVLLQIGTSNNPDVADGDLIGFYGVNGGKTSATSAGVFGVAKEANPDTGAVQYVIVATDFNGGAMSVKTDGVALSGNNVLLEASTTGGEEGKCQETATAANAFGRAFGTNGGSAVWATWKKL